MRRLVTSILRAIPGVRLLVPGGPAILGAEVGTWAALSPSLLPRRMWQTALNVAGCQAAGHAIAAGIYRSVGGFPVPHRVVSGITGFAFVRSIFRQNEIADLVDSPRPTTRDTVLGTLAGTAGYVGCVLVGEIMKVQFGWVRGLIRRAFPNRPRVPVPALSALAITATTWLIGTRFLVVRQLASRVTQKAEELNLFINPTLARPTSPLRSGSPESLMTWESLGAKGREYVSASSRADTAIRIYGGISSSVVDVLAEMDRTGAWERDYLIIHISTGTGWVNPWHVRATEELTDGNVANISMQYSYLQSPITYIADRSTPVEAARELITAILARRTHGVYIAGESLGAYGAASNDDLLSQVDGAVFTGTPRFTPIITRVSNPPHLLPVVDGGEHIRFLATPEHLAHDWKETPYRERWESPRIAFVQHPSDPVALFDWPIFFLPPRWMKDRIPGADTTPALMWWPLFTGWQMLVDMPTSHRQTGGHGHTYHEELLPIWRAVLGVGDSDDES